VLSARALDGLPEISSGDDLGALIIEALDNDEPATQLTDGHVLVIAHKVVSKVEGRVKDLTEVAPGPRAIKLAHRLEKDPRLVEVILAESREVLRASRGVLVCVTHHGFVCANAGVDASNVPGADHVVVLPHDPDRSARELRQRIRALTGASPAIVITDSFGRAWRNGQSDVAIGCAGIRPLDDWRGRTDAYGRELRATVLAVADELAATADLTRAKDRSQPVVMISGAERYVSDEDGPGARALLRPENVDLFR
jgi:coenzyme F420-0:L-glutamate ligase/coenzyme F420-1:gamma-L-glutamate ligase